MKIKWLWIPACLPVGMVFAGMTFISASAYAASFWKMDDGYKKRVVEVKKSLAVCEKGLGEYFNKKPADLLVITYPSKDLFVYGLQRELGFSKKLAEEFRNRGAPRPLEGKMLIPPDQRTSEICHEFTHYYMEGNTSKDNLLNAKWFDEGSASALAIRIMRVKNAGNAVGQSQIIPIENMQTNEQWGKLWEDPKISRTAYSQAALMVGYFLNEYSIEKFKEIFELMKQIPFDDAFKKTTGITQSEFFKKWKETN